MVGPFPSLGHKGTRKGPGWEMGYLAKLVWVSSLPLPLGETGDLED